MLLSADASFILTRLLTLSRMERTRAMQRPRRRPRRQQRSGQTWASSQMTPQRQPRYAVLLQQ